MDWNSPDDLRALVQRLRRLPSENEWIEFKVNNADPEEVGEYVSCLANSAALAGQETGYLLWGIADATHDVVGTTFRPEHAKKGNEDLYHWILRLLTPHADFSFHSVDVDGKPVVILRVAAASKLPVKFQNVEYIRTGSYKKNLSQYPDHQRRLWKVLEAYSFEDGTAVEDLGVEQVVQLLDYPAYFSLHKTPLPESRSAVIEALEAARLIRHTVEGNGRSPTVVHSFMPRTFASSPSWDERRSESSTTKAPRGSRPRRSRSGSEATPLVSKGSSHMSPTSCPTARSSKTAFGWTSFSSRALPSVSWSPTH